MKLPCGCELQEAQGRIALIWKYRCKLHRDNHSNIDYYIHCVNQLLNILGDKQFLDYAAKR